MASMVIGRSASSLGRTLSFARTATADGAIVKDPTLAAAKTGTLSTRTSDTAGTLTMAGGHGIVDGDIIDIYWADGQATAALVGTVATNSVPFTLATGDVLPIATTAITAMVQRVETFSFADADLVALAVGAGTAACSVTFYDDADAAVGAVRVARAADGATTQHYVWDDESGATIPVSDDVATIGITHGDSASSRAVTTLALVN